MWQGKDAMTDFPQHYKYMANRSQPHQYMAPPAAQAPRFQELPRLQVPSFALQQQAPAPWKASPTLAPQPPPSRMSVSNILSFRRASSSSMAAPVLAPVAPPSPPPAPVVPPAPVAAPTRRLPSFQEILARTNLLNFMSRSSEEPAAEADEEQMPMDAEMPAVAEPPSVVHTGGAFAPVGYMEAPPTMDATVAMETGDMTVGTTVGTAGTVPASPMSQASETSKRRERWTEEEHALFMEGLNRYGRKWKKIQTFVKTKTAVQVRTHAYGYFAKLLRNMPEDDAIWELAEEMSSLPGAVLKGPGNGKRRNEPKTDEEGMEVLRRFVFSKKKADEAKRPQQQLEASAATEDDNVEMADGVDNAGDERPLGRPMLPEVSAPPRRRGWPHWGVVGSSASASSEMELKRQRLS